MNHILIAIDFSESSKEVEKVGFALAKKINAKVSLVSVIDKNITYLPADTGVIVENMWEADKAYAEEALAKIKAKHSDIDCETICFIGDSKEDIIELSVQKNSTFIVMGTHGRTGMSHLLTGSTAEYIIRHSVVPIIVVPLQSQRH